MDKNKIDPLKKYSGNEDDKTLIEDDRTLVEDDRTLVDIKNNKVPPSRRSIWCKGDIINDLYRVENILKGGMGIIYIIEHLKWGIKLVVKSPLEKFLLPEHKLLFIKEAETWVDLGKHPNIATAFYVRELEGIPRIFIEFADGGSLSDWLKKETSRGIPEILDIAIQFCEGIIYAHSRGLVHRDIKPDNVLMMKDGTAKITDFGLVKTKDKILPGEGIEKLKRPATIDPYEWDTAIRCSIIGSPPYIAPEQWKKAANVDRRSDIYSFGIMLYEMICGRRPFIREADNPYPVKIAYQLMHTLDIPPDPLKFRDNIPIELKNLLLKCLEKDPVNRYNNFEEIRDELICIYIGITGKEYERTRIAEAELKADDLNNRALSYLDLGKKQEARKFLEEAIKLDPNSLWANINLIILLADESWDTYENILLRFKTLEEGNPSSPLPYYYEAIFELEWGNPVISLSLITKALELDKSNSVFWNFKGIVLNTLGNYKESLKAFEQFLKIASLKKEYIRNYAIALYYTGNYRESCNEFNKLLDMFPDDKDIKMDMAISLTGRGKFTEAISLFREVLAIEQDSIRANLYLGELLAGIDIFVPTFFHIPSNENIQEALNYLKKSISLPCYFPRISESLMEYEFKYSIRLNEHVTPSNREKNDFILLTVGEIKILKEYDARIVSTDFYSTGKKAISCSSEGVFELWDLQNGELIRKFFEKEIYMKSAVLDANISPCNNYIVSANSDRSIRIWDEGSGECIRTLYGHEDIIRSIHFSLDGKLIASASADKTARIWDFRRGECLKIFYNEGGTVFCVRFSPDAKYIAIGSQINDIYIWNIETGDLYKKLYGHSASVLTVSFNSDGQYLLSGSEDKTLKLWDIKSEKCIKTFIGHASQVECVQFSNRLHYIVSGSGDGCIKFWDIRNGKCVRTIFAYTSSVTDIKFSPDGRYLLSGSKDGSLKYIHIPMKSDQIFPSVYQKEYLLVKPRTVEETFKDVEIFQNLIAQSERHLEEEKYDMAIKGFRKALEVPGYARDERALSGINKAGKGCIRNSIRNIWLSRSYEIEKGIEKFDISEDGNLIVYCGKDNNVRLMILQTGKCVRTFVGHTAMVFDVKISRDRKYLLSGGNDKALKFWELQSGNCIKTIEVAVQAGSIALFQDSNYIATGGGMVNDTTIKIWDIQTGMCLITFEGHSRPVTSISIFNDGKKFISGSSDNSLKLWNLADNKCINNFREHTLRINDITISPYESLFVSASDDKTIKIWNINQNNSILTLTGHEDKVNSVDFSSDGRFIISGSSDKTVRLWSTEQGECLRVIEGHNAEVTDVRFSSDCRYILSSGRDNLLKVWEIDWEWNIEQKAGFSKSKKTSFLPFDEEDITPEDNEKDISKEIIPPPYSTEKLIAGEIEAWITGKKAVSSEYKPEQITSKETEPLKEKAPSNFHTKNISCTNILSYLSDKAMILARLLKSLIPANSGKALNYDKKTPSGKNIEEKEQNSE
ncbi:MAG TPA: protein kinase [Candidatus Eremiobacteraeota bacterium]|nr:MAG: Serine/threonine-protein kinase PknB [bacterium ADurb.Bin363]HPZ08134.1 protein kinase [Candidatus Eremiobacteraeota bacterium]